MDQGKGKAILAAALAGFMDGVLVEPLMRHGTMHGMPPMPIHRADIKKDIAEVLQGLAKTGKVVKLK